MSEILKSPHRNQKKPGAFFLSVQLFSFLLEKFSTLLTGLWKTFQYEMGDQKTLAKKAPDCFGVQAGDINISDNFLKIEKFR